MRIFQPTYTKKLPDGSTETRQSSKWYVAFTAGGIRHRIPLDTTDKRAAEIKAREEYKAAHLKAAGVETHHRTRETSIEKLIEEYGSELNRRERERRHRVNIEGRLQKMLEGCSRLQDVTTPKLRRRLGELARRRSLSSRTVNRYRAAVLAFFKWLIAEERWAENPAQAIKPLKEIPTYDRRALTDEERKRLLSTAPPHRSLCYQLACSSGLRRKELKALRVEHLDLDRRSLRLPGTETKNRHRVDALPLPASIVERLRPHVEELKPSAKVFRAIPKVTTLYADLRRSGIEQDTSEGRIDFHALRVTYITDLARAGVPLQVAQKLARHCDPKLTANIYSRLGERDHQLAIGRLEEYREAFKVDLGDSEEEDDEEGPALTSGPVAPDSPGDQDGSPRAPAGSPNRSQKRRLDRPKNGRGEAASLVSGLSPKRASPCVSVHLVTGFGKRKASGVPTQVVVGAEGEGFEPPDALRRHRFSKQPTHDAEASIHGDSQRSQDRLSAACPGRTPDATEGPHDTGLAARAELARSLLAQASTVSDPRALLEAARILLEEALISRRPTALDEHRSTG